MTKPRPYQVFYVDGDGNYDSLRVRAQSADDAEDQVLAVDPESHSFIVKELEATDAD